MKLFYERSVMIMVHFVNAALKAMGEYLGIDMYIAGITQQVQGLLNGKLGH